MAVELRSRDLLDGTLRKDWLLLIDLDKTLWDCEDVSITRPPYKRLDKYVLADATGRLINVREYMVEFLRWAKSHGALVAVLSQNRRDLAMQALETLRLADLFDYYEIDYHARKDLMFHSLARRLREHGLYQVFNCVVYIDDSRQQLERVSALVDTCCLQLGLDFIDYSSLIKNISNCLIRCGVLNSLLKHSEVSSLQLSWKGQPYKPTII